MMYFYNDFFPYTVTPVMVTVGEKICGKEEKSGSTGIKN